MRGRWVPLLVGCGLVAATLAGAQTSASAAESQPPPLTAGGQSVATAVTSTPRAASHTPRLVMKRVVRKRVKAGQVRAVAKLRKACGPVELAVAQGATVTRGRGNSTVVVNAPVRSGRVKVILSSYACRSPYHLTIKNRRPARPAPGWVSVFGEDFGRDAGLGSFLSSYQNFGAYPYPWTDTSRQERSNPGYYHPEKTLSVSGGVLDAWLHYDSSLGKFLVAAPTPNLPTMTYGRFAMRLRADRIPGYKIAPLLWPDSERWPDDGEIDFPEGDLTGSPLEAFHHFARAAGGQDSFDTGVDPTAWHVYETLWTPGKVEFLVDGRSIGSSTSYVPSNPMHWVLQMETQISPTAPSTSAQGHVQIDWVKAYKMA